jgi:hypothetical protein
MDDKKLQETFKRAAEIASVVPESMHEAAFNRALDALMGTSTATPPHPPSHRSRGTTGGKAEPASDDAVSALMRLERSRAPEVDAAEGGLAKALALMFVARRELGIDGLTSQEMATVLTEKFRWRVTRQALNEAMDKAGNRVDRNKSGRATRYRVMHAGEEWLTKSPGERSGEQTRTSGGSSSRRRRKQKHTQPESTPTASSNSAGSGKRTTTRRPGRGPTNAVESLMDSGWFKTPRGLGDIRKELESRLALRYKPTDLSPVMTRLLRDGRLTRSKAESGQYEYQS